jgi:hypothetical protein
MTAFDGYPRIKSLSLAAAFWFLLCLGKEQEFFEASVFGHVPEISVVVTMNTQISWIVSLPLSLLVDVPVEVCGGGNLGLLHPFFVRCVLGQPQVVVVFSSLPLVE